MSRDAFIARKENGLSLSDRVWRYTEGFKTEMEMGLDLGIRAGKSADQISRDLRQYLQHPDMLFRRVRDEHGILHLSQRAKAFHPGQGVYRSSYLNARRLAVTETNAAYRTADHERWQNLDFVVGIEIHLSGNHTCKGRDGKQHAFTDICDELAGRYPKDFKFTGWHPHCRCYATTVLKTPEEMDADTAKILDGEPVDGRSVNRVDDVPEGFTKWLEDNKKRAETHYSVPYFLKDNLQYVPKALMEAYGSRMPYDTYAEYEAAMKYNKKHSTLTKEQMKNVRELNRVMPVVQGKIMDIDEADRGHCNPMFGTENYVEKGYNKNCQTCTMAYELRRRGFNINAMGSPNGELDFYQFCKNNGLDWKHRFLNADGSTCDYSWSNKQSSMNDTVAKKKGFIQGCMSESGRYEIYCSWKGKKNIAHVFVIEKQPNGNMMWFDPQTGETGKVVEKKVSRMKAFQIGVMRIDDKIINPRFAPRFLKS